MNWLDGVLALIILASVVTSFRKGLSREIFGVVTVCIALLLGIWLYGTVGGYLLPYLSSRPVANFSGFAIVFCAVMLLGSLIGAMIGKFVKITGLSIFDHALGAGFGVVRGILVSVALVMGIMAFSQTSQPPASVVNSRIAPYMIDAAHVVSAMAPHELKEGFRITYGRVKSAWDTAARKTPQSEQGRKKTQNERHI